MTRELLKVQAPSPGPAQQVSWPRPENFLVAHPPPSPPLRWTRGERKRRSIEKSCYIEGVVVAGGLHERVNIEV